MHKSHKKKKQRNRHYNQENLTKLNGNENPNGDNKLIVNNINNNDNVELNSIIGDNTLLKVKESEIMGRYVIAKKDISPGAVIIQEKPLVVGPCADTPMVCLGCYYNFEKDKDIKLFKCPGCGWNLCSNHCLGINHPYGHSKIECSTLSRVKEGTNSWYATITPLRCLLLEKTDPDAYKKLLKMESLNEIRRKRSNIWLINQKCVVDRIINSWKLSEYTEEHLHTICGILEVNAFEVGQHGISVRALYPTAFLLAHDCIPNTTHTDDGGNNFRMTIRAAKPIATEEIVTLSYAYTLQSTMLRRQHLFDTKFFWCQCQRCKDPTEMGTDTGTLRCPRCPGGRVMTTNPLDQDAVWKCNNPIKLCPGYSIPAKTVKLLMDRISNEIESIDSNDVSSFEGFLQRYRNVLHPNHFHCLGVKHSLSQLYGKITGYMIQDLPQKLLERKIDICREIMKIFNTLEPGLSRLRGITLYELHAPLMILATRDFELKSISKQELRKRLKEVVFCLKESAKILSFEPDNSVEGVMASAAKDALDRIKDWEKILGKI